MRKREGAYTHPLEFSDLAARGGGGGRTRVQDTRPRASEMKPTPPRPDPTEGHMRQIERSIEERGGYPTRGGKPLMTKMQQRELQRRREFEEQREAAKGRRPFRFAEGGVAHDNKSYQSFNQGGIVQSFADGGQVQLPLNK